MFWNDINKIKEEKPKKKGNSSKKKATNPSS